LRDEGIRDALRFVFRNIRRSICASTALRTRTAVHVLL
jgi:hypothetical protein